MAIEATNYLVIGMNHKTAPLDVREKFSIGPEILNSVLGELVGRVDSREMVVLSTCNRTEIYSFGSSPSPIIDWLSEFSGIGTEVLLPHLYVYAATNAAEHLFRLASGLESMVIGETQIVGQIKVAVQRSKDLDMIGPKLLGLFDTAFSVAKEVRTNTDIGVSSVSLPAAALKVALRVYGRLHKSRILFIGAGNMTGFCAQYFSGVEHGGLSFTNRTLENAQALAERYSGSCFPLEEMPTLFHKYDIVISCTGSMLPIISRELIVQSLRKRLSRPIVIIDLAIPRDVDGSVSDIEDIFLYTVDDLGEIVKTGRERRNNAIDEAEKHISIGLNKFEELMSFKEQIVPTVKSFREFGESLMFSQQEKALQRIAKGDKPEDVIRSFSRSLMNKFLDRPSRLLSDSGTSDREQLARSLQRLYSLKRADK